MQPSWEPCTRDNLKQLVSCDISKPPSSNALPQGEREHTAIAGIGSHASIEIDQSLAMRRFRLWFMLLVLLTSVAPARAENRLNVVASFSILGDFARNVGGDRVSVTTLVGPDGDVHVYSQAPSDAQKVADARLVIINGLGLEGWLSRLGQSSRRQGTQTTAPPGHTPP